MIIELERTPLTELAEHFSKMGWGSEGVLLGCLREGKLVASINYPTDWPSLREVPKEVWQEMGQEDFDVWQRSSRFGRTDDRGSEYNISGKHFFDDEFEKIRTIARAAVEHDVTLIPENVMANVLDQLSLSCLDDFTDWLNLVRVFHEMAQSLEADRTEDFPVFVTQENLSSFTSRHVPVQKESKKGGSSGAPRIPYWPELYGQLIIMIVEQQQTNLLGLTGNETWGDLSGKLMKWAEANIVLKPNTKLPEQDSLERHIKKFQKQGLK